MIIPIELVITAACFPNLYFSVYTGNGSHKIMNQKPLSNLIQNKKLFLILYNRQFSKCLIKCFIQNEMYQIVFKENKFLKYCTTLVLRFPCIIGSCTLNVSSPKCS